MYNANVETSTFVLKGVLCIWLKGLSDFLLPYLKFRDIGIKFLPMRWKSTG